MHGSNVLATAKHFPGLGRVTVNTDYAADAVDGTTTTSDPYLAPFRQAVDAGVDLVMVSTARYTKIDPQHLAAFSPVVMDLLRTQMHFAGVIVADDLGGAVAVASIPAGDRAVNFIAAGGDLITVKHAELVAPMAAAVLNRAATDAAFAAQADTATKRILRLKVRAGVAGCSG
jgi:beta-N-acetylhexosaminidase